MKNIAIFASGNGSNAENIINYLHERKIQVNPIIYTNKADAYVIKRAEKLKVPYIVFNRQEFYENGEVLLKLKENKTELIILAGFLWLIPKEIILTYPDRIINIHPALLPKYGGKGMYGDRVHKAVIDAGEKESGISIHYVNENYDEGQIIKQVKCPVAKDDTPESLAEKVHALEYKHYPEVIETLLSTKKQFPNHK